MLETRSATQDHAAGKDWGAPVRAVPPRRPSAVPAVLLGLGVALAVVAVAAGQAWSELALDAAVVLLGFVFARKSLRRRERMNARGEVLA